MNTEAQSYNPSVLMVCSVARLINDYENVFVGVGISLFAGLVAKTVYAPNATMMYEGGGIGAVTRRMTNSISDNPISDNALLATELWRMFADTQRGYVHKAIIGGAQVDKYGNVNSSVILGDGYGYQHPRVRLPGCRGAVDLTTSCKNYIVLSPLRKGKIVEKVDFISSPGFINGPGDRERFGMEGGGPLAVVTNKCVFRFDSQSKEMYLAALYPGVKIEAIKANLNWDVRVADDLYEVEPPTAAELKALEKLDPLKLTSGIKTSGTEDFDDWYWKIRKSYEASEILL